MEKVKLKIKGMHCASCALNIENKLSEVNGVKGKVSYATESATINYEGQLPDKEILKTIEGMGYKAFFETQDELGDFATDPVCGMKVPKKKSIKKDFDGKTYYFCSQECLDKFEAPEKELKNMKKRVAVAVSGALILGALRLFATFTLATGVSVVSWVPIPSMPFFTWGVWLFIITTPIQFIGGWSFYKGAYNAIKNRVLNMDFLIALGTLTAYFYSVFIVFLPGVLPVSEKDVYFEVSAVIIAFVLLGKFMEDYMKRRTSLAVRKLLDLRPKTAIVQRDGKEIEIPAEEIMIGEIVIVKPGQKIPVDGSVLNGETYIDESMVTGESNPVIKKEGSEVIGGTINKHGLIKFKALKVGSETTLMQIVKMVEEAQASSAPIQRIADKVSAVFVPAVIGVAFLSFLSWWVFGNFTLGVLSFVAVLIISCPCALGIATPTALMVGVGKGAEAGILIRGGEYLEKAYKLTKVVFDKTGTLTKGRPEVTSFIAVDKSKEEELIKLVASVEKGSEHPLSDAIINFASQKNIELLEVDNFKAISGKGVKGIIDGHEIFVVSPSFAKSERINIKLEKSVIEKLEHEGNTVIVAARDKEMIGIFAIADAIKETSVDAIKSLKNMGIESVILTGDNERTAKAVAKKIGIKEVIADVLPGDKLNVIKKLQSENNIVAMVGDGINDAPALAQADIGIAIGSGSDVAKETGGIILVKDDLRDVSKAIGLSKKTMQKIKQNLFWAFFYNIIAIPVAALGFLNPMIAAAAMALSSLSVVSNSALLKKYKIT
jgi:Cu+-exporting ATPase